MGKMTPLPAMGVDVAFTPGPSIERPIRSPDDLTTLHVPEQDEIAPAILVEIRDASGELIRRVPGPRGKGIHRVAWDLRWPDVSPVNLRRSGPETPWDDVPAGPLAAPCGTPP